jgi:YidC/Oxa1 family membrane protein insertase
MDKNQIIGMTLLSLLFIGYISFVDPPQEELTEENVITQTDNTTLDDKTTNQFTKQENPLANLSDSVLELRKGIFGKLMTGTPQDVVLENKEVKITLSSQGGKVKEVELKTYKTWDKKKLILFDEQSQKMKWEVQTNTPANKVDLYDLYYQVVQKSDKAVTFRINFPSGKVVEQTYTLAEKGFVLNYDMNLDGLSSYLSDQTIQVLWQDNLKKVDEVMDLSRRYSTLNYYETEGGHDYLTKESTDLQEEILEEPIKWLSMQNRFFNAALITDKQFSDVKVKSFVNEKDTLTVKELEASFAVKIADLKAESTMHFYFGPNDYYINSEVAENIHGAEGFEKNVYMGYAIFAPISRYIIIPLFNFLEKFVDNYGLIVLILVFVIRTAMSPLTYKSYTSSSKMKVLQPEIAKLKKKYGDGQDAKQKIAAEQMKLFGEFGVNPLSGCLPMLLQMPIFLSLFFFFPSAIALRGESFLWAHDLATFDSILALPFEIPFYGSHISLFTLLMAGTQILMTQVTPQPNAGGGAGSDAMPFNPKVMMYMMPVFMLFFLNSYPAALTLYYFASNSIAVTQSFVIRKFFVNDEKILAKLEKRRKMKQQKSGGKKSGFMQRVQKMQEESQKAKENTVKQRLKKTDKRKKK